jgi:hypothetical protein
MKNNDDIPSTDTNEIKHLINRVKQIVNVFLLPSPTWFTALDLICAYIPMGWFAGKLAASLRPESLKMGSSA